LPFLAAFRTFLILFPDFSPEKWSYWAFFTA
jgi:hypothetical protein